MRKIAVGLLGVIVLTVGVAFLFLPAPAIVVIPLGLAILGTEFSWAKTLSVRLRRLFLDLHSRLTRPLLRPQK